MLFIFLLPQRAEHLKAPPKPARVVSTLAALRRPSRQSFRDCANCPELLAVPAGTFRMGSTDPRSGTDEHDIHMVTIAKPFAVGKFDVTFDEWANRWRKNRGQTEAQAEEEQTRRFDEPATPEGIAGQADRTP